LDCFKEQIRQQLQKTSTPTGTRNPSDIDNTSNVILSLLSAVSRPCSSTKYLASAPPSASVGQTNLMTPNVHSVGSSISAATTNAARMASRVAVTLTR